MFEVAHYPEVIKKTIVGFGSLFSKIKIIRRKNDGTVGEIVKVPIGYGPKEKYIVRVEQDPALSNNVLITLPRLAFEITGYHYDAERKINRNNKIQCFKDGALSATYAPVPYNIEISLYLLSKGTEDSLAVLEQILPIFNPEYTLTVQALPEMLVNVDIPIVLNGVDVYDPYDGDFATRRLVTHTFNFTAKVQLFGEVNSGSSVIMRTETALPNLDLNHTSQVDSAGDLTLDQWTNP